jgi:tRNA A-37 threonylcarbamoyl transferase component Bud32
VAEPLEVTVGPAPERTMHDIRLLRRGGSFKADVKKVVLDGRPAILKDFAGKTWAARLLGRRQVARERRALLRLADVAGVPRLLGETGGGTGLLMTRMEGDPITAWLARHPEAAGPLFDRLARLVAVMHARGVVHNDLRKRDNILVRADGSPVLIDFNASVCLPLGSAAGRLLLGVLRRIDEGAIFKWKARLAPALLAPAEARWHRVLSVLRRLWIFN